MPALNFQKQFAPAVESGAKRQTIRAMRKRPFVAGDRLTLWTGMRSKSSRKLAEVDCISAVPIKIKDHAIIIDGKLLPSGLNAFAQADGFDDFAAMVAWFRKTHGLPFEGQLITW